MGNLTATSDFVRLLQRVHEAVIKIYKLSLNANTGYGDFFIMAIEIISNNLIKKLWQTSSHVNGKWAFEIIRTEYPSIKTSLVRPPYASTPTFPT